MSAPADVRRPSDAVDPAQEALAARLRAARTAQLRWRDTPLTDRLAVLRRCRHALGAAARELAEACASPLHRSTSEAIAAEVLPLLDAMRWLERRAGAVLGDEILGSRGRPLWLGRLRTRIVRDPLGVVLVVAPGNYPLMLAGIHLMQALCAGNAVALKPAPGGAGEAAAAWLQRELLRSGLPADLLLVLPEEPQSVHAACAVPGAIDHVVVTGSLATGRAVYAAAAAAMVPVTAELSGCDAVVLLSDADLDRVAQALRFGVGLNRGATCIAPRRVLGSEAQLTELARLVPALVDGLPPTKASSETLAAVQAAVDAGAELLAPLRVGQPGPYVLGRVTQDMAVAQRDLPGGVLALVACDDADDALAQVNAAAGRLGVALFGGRGASRDAYAARLQTGLVVCDDLIAPSADPRVPFGGRGASGFGVTRGAAGLAAMTTPKAIAVRPRRRGVPRHWSDPQTADTEVLAALAGLLHAPGVRARWAAIRALLRAARAGAEGRTDNDGSN